MAAVKENDSEILKSLYQANYPKIEALVLKNNGSTEQAKDIFQEAFLAFWRNTRAGKFTPKSESAIGGYIYQIAKFKWTDVLRSAHNKKVVSMEEKFPNPIAMDILSDEDEEKLERVMKAFGDLGDGCKTILTLFYFDKKSMRDISASLEIDEASARNKKYRCMQRLKALVFIEN